MDDTARDKKVVGSIKEAIGKVTGDSPLRTEGEADQAAADGTDSDAAATADKT